MNLEKKLLTFASGVALAVGLYGQPATSYADNGKRILIRGVGAYEDSDISSLKGNFDSVIHLSTGDPSADAMKAEKEMRGFPEGRRASKELVDAERSEIQDVYAHSWGTEAAYNEIKSGRLVVKGKLVLINTPSAMNLSKWYELSEDLGIKIEVYQGASDYVPAIPAAKDGIKMAIHPVDYVTDLIKRNSGPPKGNVTMHVYEGGHDLKAALTHLDYVGEFGSKPQRHVPVIPNSKNEITRPAHTASSGNKPQKFAPVIPDSKGDVQAIQKGNYCSVCGGPCRYKN